MDANKAPGSKQTLIYMSATFTIFMWASNYPAIKYMLEYYSPGSIALLRFFIGATILFVISVIKKVRPPQKKDLPMFALCGFVGVFLFAVFLNTGTGYVAAGVSSFIVASAPVFSLILSRIMLKEIVKPVCWFGVALSLCGLIVVMVNQTEGLSLNIGVFLLLFAAISGALYNIFQRGLLKNYTVLEATTYTVTAAVICMFIFIPDVVRELPHAPWGANLAAFYVGAFPGAVAYLTWGYALSKADKTTHVTVFLYLTPFIASILGFFLLHETFSIWSLLGGIVIVAGMGLTNILGRSK